MVVWKKAGCEFVLMSLLQLNGVVPQDNLVLIKMRPDEHGRFGFNVKVRTEVALHFLYLVKTGMSHGRPDKCRVQT